MPARATRERESTLGRVAICNVGLGVCFVHCQCKGGRAAVARFSIADGRRGRKSCPEPGHGIDVTGGFRRFGSPHADRLF